MSKYIKILLITGLIQLLGYAAARLSDSLVNTEQHSSLLPFFVMVFSWGVSLAVTVILSLRWYSTVGAKILGILLMPTNYTFLIVVWYGFRLVAGFLKILSELPDNLG